MRARLCPQVDPTVRIAITEPDPDLGMQLTYRLTRSGGRGAAKLPAPVAALLLYFDGQKSCEEIQDEIEAQGIDLPQSDFVQVLAESLERVGIIQMHGRPLTVIGPHRFACVSCGNSCRGERVGPLASKEVALLEQQWSQIRVEYPELASLEPLERTDEGHVFLARPNDGKCTFLADDNRCIIHARFGFENKPLACRLFPLVTISAGESVRIGTSGACARLHQTFDSATSVDMLAEWKHFDPDVTPLKRRYGQSGRIVTTSVEEDRDMVDTDSEESLCAWLESHPLGIGGIAHMAAFLVEPPAAGRPVPVAIANELAQSCRRLAAALDDDEVWLTSLSEADREVLVNASRVLGSAELLPGDLDQLDERSRRYLAYRTANYLWLREGHGFGKLQLALAFAATAAAAGAWFARLGSLDASEGEDTPFNRFGRLVGIMARYVQHLGEHVLPPDEHDSPVKRWEQHF